MTQADGEYIRKSDVLDALEVSYLKSEIDDDTYQRIRDMPSVAIPSADGDIISIKKVHSVLHNHMFDNAHRPSIYAELKRISKELDGLSVAIPTSPCDLCQYNPPSSTDGKPCTMCPAVKIER